MEEEGEGEVEGKGQKWIGVIVNRGGAGGESEGARKMEKGRKEVQLGVIK